MTEQHRHVVNKCEDIVNLQGVFIERGDTKLSRDADTAWNWNSSKWLKAKDIKSTVDRNYLKANW